MRVLRLVILMALSGCAFAAGAAVAKAAERGPCIPGQSKPRCYHWDGEVTRVSDGDTIDVDIFGDGKAKSVPIRITGINAMEQTKYSSYPDRREGVCHSLEATARVDRLFDLSNHMVRLSAQKPSSKSGKRKRRAVAVRRGGQWTDIGQILIDEGRALHLPNNKEWAWNVRYSRGAQHAALAGVNLWDTDSCGHGPYQGATLRMWVNWDADGSDNPKLNGEWAKIKNFSNYDVSINGWRFRDSKPRTYKFPSDAVIPAGRAVTLFIGPRPKGDKNRLHHYWRQGSPIFDNVGSRGKGDGGYLYDRDGDLRVWTMYPCRVVCADPLAGQVIATADPETPERVFLKNVGALAADLEGYVIENLPHNYSLPAGTVLHPGETFRLFVKGKPSKDRRLVRHWAKSRYILNNGGDVVSLRTQTDVTLSCYAWGRSRC